MSAAITFAALTESRSAVTVTCAVAASTTARWRLSRLRVVTERNSASIPSAPSLTASAALDDPPISFRYVTRQPTAGGIPMHAPDDSTTPSRSVTVMRRLIRPWEYRRLRAVAGVRWPDER